MQDEISTIANRSVIIAASELLANDSENGGADYTIASVQDGEHGAVSLDADGNVVFTPDEDHYGPAVFSYTAIDADGNSSTATVTVDVRATLDDPTFIGYSQKKDEWDVTQLADGTHVVIRQSGVYYHHQRYDASGEPLGPLVKSEGINAIDANITGLANGNYVITYSHPIHVNDAVRFQVFNSAGTLLKEVKFVEENEAYFGIGEGVDSTNPDIIALQDGGFILVMSREIDGHTDGQDTFGLRHDASGNVVGDMFDLSGFSAGNDRMATGIELADGRLLLLMMNGSNETVGQLFSSGGHPLGTSFVVRDFVGTTDTSDPMYMGLGAKPALLADGSIAIVSGRELVVYSIGSDNSVNETSRVNLETLGPDGWNIVSGDVIALADGGYFAVFNSREAGEASYHHVYGQRYDASGNPVHGVVDFGELVDGQETYVKLEHADDGGAYVYFSNPYSVNTSKLYKIHVDSGVTGETLDPAQYREYAVASADDISTVANRSVIIAASELLANDGENGGEGYSITSVQSGEHGTVSLNVDGSVTFTPEADYYGPAVFSYTATDADGHSSTATVTMDVRATLDQPTFIGYGPRKNGFDVTQLADGSHVVIRQSGVYIEHQRYDASGEPLGPLVKSEGVNAIDANITGLANGNYVITYSHPIHVNDAVRVQVFNSTGTLLKEVKFVEENEAYFGIGEGVDSTNPDIIALQDGGFILVMSREIDGHTDGQDTFGLRHDASGNVVGDMFDLSGFSAGNDRMATGIELADGRLLLLMMNGSNETVGQLFSSGGHPLGTSFVVRDFVGTTDTSDPMYMGLGAKPALLADGSIAIVSGRELVVYSIGSDNSVNETSRVNLETLGPDGWNIVSGDVIALADGGYFAVFNSREAGEASYHHVYGQRYDASGNPVHGVVDFGELVTGYYQLTDGRESYLKLEHAEDGGVYIYFSNYRSTNSLEFYKIHVDSSVTGETLDPAQYREYAIASADDISTVANRSVIIAASELLSNDGENGGEGYSISSVQSGEHGTVSLDADGNVVFTPEADYYGPAVFSYTATDADGHSSTATVTMDVRATLDQPTFIGYGPRKNGFDVTQLADGSHVVIRQSGVYIEHQRYDASGEPLGPLVKSEGVNAIDANITGLANGNYAITYSHISSSNDAVRVQLFNSTGTLLKEVKLIDEWGDNTNPDIIALQDGGFILVMSRESDGQTDGQDTFGQRYNASGNVVGDMFDLSGFSAGNDRMATGIELADGRLLLLMMNGSNETVGQLFSSGGHPLGTSFVVRDFVGTTDTSDPMYMGLGAKPALLADGSIAIVSGRELVVYSIGSDNSVNETSRVNLETLGPDGWNIVSGDVIALADGGYFAVFNSREAGEASYHHVYGQRYDASENPVHGVVDFGELVTGYYQLTDGRESYLKLAHAEDGGVYIYFSNYRSTNSLEFYKIHVDSGVTGETLDPAQYREYAVASADDISTVANRSVIIAASELLANDGENVDGYAIASVQSGEHGTVSLNVDGSVTFTPDADYYGPAKFSYVVYDGLGGNSSATVTVDVRATLDDPTKLSPGYVVEGEADGRVEWDVAQLSDGSQVVTWYDGAYRIYRQRYDASGAPTGSRQTITVSLNTTGINITGLANGNYIITYSDAPESTVKFQLFNATGNRLTDVSLQEAGVNISDADIIALQDGGFVLVMSRQVNGETIGEDTFGQRYDASGNEVGELFDLSGLAGGNDTMATGLELPDGRLLMMMKNGANETVGQVFSSAGYPLGTTFVIRDFVGTNDTTDPMYFGLGAKPTLLADGRVAVVSGRSLVVYEFGSDNVVTELTRVDLATLDPDGGNVVSGDVIALVDGGYFTVFNSREGNASSPYQVYGQRYDASGNPVNGVVDFGELVDGQETYVKLEHADDGGVYIYFSNPISSSHAELYKIHVDSGVTGETLDPAQYRDYKPEVGGVGNDVITGSALSDALVGNSGDDVLDGGAGNDLISGGSGADTFVFGRGFDHDTITDADAADQILLQPDVLAEDVWLFQQGDDLVIQLLGSQDNLTVANWYSPAAQKVGEIEIAGSTLQATNVQNLVDAMSVFGINDVAVDSIDHNSTEFQNAQAVIAANWQSS